MAVRQKFTEVKHFEHFICHLSVVPLYEKAGYEEPIVTQLLFGETGKVIAKKNKLWHKIKTDHNLPESWVSTDQITLISEQDYLKFVQTTAYLLDINHTILHDQNPLNILLGSCLRNYDGISFRMPEGKYICSGLVAVPDELPKTQEVLVKIARRFLSAPYMKGGRTPYGIDTVRMVQLIMRNFGISLPGSTQELVQYGNIVDFIEMTQIGDIAFFHDDNGEVYHCGIMIGPRECLHTDGHTKSDKLDHFGIYCHQRRRYTHKLRVIKRICDFK